jgi:hypothetical protein
VLIMVIIGDIKDNSKYESKLITLIT